MTSETEKVTENGEPKNEEFAGLSRKRETNWLKVLFQIQLNLSALCAIHYLLYDSYWSTIFFCKYFIYLFSYNRIYFIYINIYMLIEIN